MVFVCWQKERTYEWNRESTICKWFPWIHMERMIINLWNVYFAYAYLTKTKAHAHTDTLIIITTKTTATTTNDGANESILIMMAKSIKLCQFCACVCVCVCLCMYFCRLLWWFYFLDDVVISSRFESKINGNSRESNAWMWN